MECNLDIKGIDEALREADRLRRYEHFSQARAVYLKIAGLDSTDSNTRTYCMIRAALCMRTQGEMENAIVLLGAVLRDYADNETACVIAGRELAHTLRAQGHYVRSIKLFKKLLHERRYSEGQQAETRRYMGHALLARGRFREAAESYCSILAKHPSERAQCAAALRSLGHSYIPRLDFGNAAAVLGKVLLEYPDQPEQCSGTLRSLGNCFRTNGEYGAAIGFYDKMLKTYPRFEIECANTNIERGKTLMFFQDYRGAVDCFRLIADNFRNFTYISTGSRICEANVLISMNRHKEADELLKSLLEENQHPASRAEIQLKMAYNHYTAGKLPEAFLIFTETADRLLAFPAQVSKALYGMASVYRRDLCHDKALELYTHIAQTFREYPQAFSSHIWIYLYGMKAGLNDSSRTFTLNRGLAAHSRKTGYEYLGWENRAALQFQYRALQCSDVKQLIPRLENAIRRTLESEWKSDFADMIRFKLSYDRLWVEFSRQILNSICKKQFTGVREKHGVPA
jgi:tetratricopeptide (TPR) repeat protein